jgi:hypothetical protein
MAQRYREILGCAAVGLSTLAGCFWAFWLTLIAPSCAQERLFEPRKLDDQSKADSKT